MNFSILLRPMFVALVAFPCVVFGQGTPAQQPDAIPLFRATLPGGKWMVPVRNIVSVSSHEYVVDALARVFEVNIDTSGSIIARFYFIEPAISVGPSGLGSGSIATAQKLLTEGADKILGEAWRKVVKSYPTTTHARTVEYRLNKKEQLDAIYAAAEECLRTQKPKSVSISNE